MICFIDFETTGIDVFRDEPIEIGAILVDESFTIRNEFSSRITLKKSTYFSKRAFKINNIALDDLSNSPTQKAVIDNFFNEFGTDFRFAGWNISFDVSFFRKLCHNNSMMVKYNKINHRHIDVQTLSYLINELDILSVKNESLSDWVKYFNLNRNHFHSALEDAKLTFEVYKNMLKLLKK